MPATRGRRASTRRAVNALATSLRSLVCSGGSIPLTEPAANISKPCRAAAGRNRQRPGEALVDEHLADVLIAADQPDDAAVG